MALIKKPVTGMKDILPAEMEIRDYCISVIKKTYAEFGFQSIETPCVENIANLTSKQGGDNEKLIFKILKRGEKLKLESAQSEADLVDGGLRYDLTVPLVRYFSNHQNELPMPFKALQMGNVWRADRPQKGRYRQFMQCDIDIIGEPSNLAEIELILATTTTLGNLGFKNFQIRINERRILKAMAAYSGFPEDRYTDVFIILDKMDKIGLDGAAEELIGEGFTEEMRDRYVSLFEGLQSAQDQLAYLEEKLEACPTIQERSLRSLCLNSASVAEAADVMTEWSASSPARMSPHADFPSVSRGSSFILILMEQGFQIPGRPVKKAYLIEKNMPADRLCEVIRQAQKERAEGTQVLIARMAKNKKFQKQSSSSRSSIAIRSVNKRQKYAGIRSKQRGPCDRRNTDNHG